MNFAYNTSYCPLFFAQPTSAQQRYFQTQYQSTVQNFRNLIRTGKLTKNHNHRTLADLDLGMTVGELSLIIAGGHYAAKKRKVSLELPTLSEEEKKRCMDSEL